MRLMRTLALMAAVAGAGFVAAPVMAEGPKADSRLISRDVLFGNPARGAVRISPDGRYLSWVAPVDGVLNVWVAPLENLDAAKPVTKDTKRGVQIYSWSYSPDVILYQQDEGGNENWNIYSLNVSTGESRNLVNNPKVAARIGGVSHKHPNEILIALNDRNPMFHDLWRVNLVTGEKSLLMQNPGVINGNMVAGLVPDDDFKVRFVGAMTNDGGSELFKPAEKPGEWVSVKKVGMEDAMTTSPVGFDATGKTYLMDSRGRDTAALFLWDSEKGTSTLIAEDPRVDLGSPMLHPTEKTPQAVEVNYTSPEWRVLDPKLQQDFDTISKLTNGRFDVTSRTLDDRKWIVAQISDVGPIRYHLYDRDSKQARFLFTNRPELEKLSLAPMHPVVIEARDGRKLVSYLTLPKQQDASSPSGPVIRLAEGEVRAPSQPVPLVLNVHGGPWARDSWGFNPEHQWLADRGYAVLSVNFRGSTGFGKDFINASNRQWGGTMHDDLLDAVKWAVDNKIADPSKVAIYGGSYGGYAALVGATFTPDVFACAVSVVGPSNLNTLLSTIPPYWAPALKLFHTRVGDNTTPEGREFLNSRSPLSKVENIKRPLLIGQGANDPRVKQSESDQIVKAMKERGIPVTYVLYADEGHGFVRPANRLSFYAVTEAFLAQHLGGKFEPVGDDFAGASVSVPAGAEYVPGLSDALTSLEKN